jgi:hypothetical protein
MKEEKEKSLSMEMKKIKPLKDFVIHMNEYHYELKKGESIEVPSIFVENLKTEKVIK